MKYKIGSYIKCLKCMKSEFWYHSEIMKIIGYKQNLYVTRQRKHKNL